MWNLKKKKKKAVHTGDFFFFLFFFLCFQRHSVEAFQECSVDLLASQSAWGNWRIIEYKGRYFSLTALLLLSAQFCYSRWVCTDRLVNTEMPYHRNSCFTLGAENVASLCHLLLWDEYKFHCLGHGAGSSHPSLFSCQWNCTLINYAL